MEQIELQPDPSSLIVSLRDIGYTPQSAVADIVDNSVTAHAESIEIHAEWNAGDPWIAITDDGCGMTADELIAAMRPGSRSPSELRTKEDLGRFGLGLKTASFSLAKKLTVISRRDSDSELSSAAWDLDEVVRQGRWVLTTNSLTAQESEAFSDVLPQATGTTVLWQSIDRLVDKTAGDRGPREFDRQLAVIEEHLSQVFHRFLEAAQPPVTAKRLSISINGTKLVPSSPFASKGTQELPKEPIRIDNEQITVHPYILPHHSKLSTREYERLGGKEGYVSKQGFYIYRNYRLIISGTWFRLRPRSELARLVRIRVDIPNTLDHLWTIDVRKSKASIPLAVRDRLDGLLEGIIERGKQVYVSRGHRTTAKSEAEPLWVRIAKNSQIEYRVNNEHPALEALSASLEPEERKQLNSILRMVAENFPKEMFYADYSGNPKAVGGFSSSTLSDTDAEGREMIKALWRSRVSKSQIENILLNTKPYGDAKDLHQSWKELISDLARS